MRRRPASEIGRQLTAFVLQALLLGGEMKIHASSPPQPPGRFRPVGSHTIASIKGVPADGRIQDGARRRVIANASAAGTAFTRFGAENSSAHIFTENSMPHAMLSRSKIDASGPLRLTRWRGRGIRGPFRAALPPSRQTRNRLPTGPVGHLRGIQTVARYAKKKGRERSILGGP